MLLASRADEQFLFNECPVMDLRPWDNFLEHKKDGGDSLRHSHKMIWDKLP